MSTTRIILRGKCFEGLPPLICRLRRPLDRYGLGPESDPARPRGPLCPRPAGTAARDGAQARCDPEARRWSACSRRCSRPGERQRSPSFPLQESAGLGILGRTGWGPPCAWGETRLASLNQGPLSSPGLVCTLARPPHGKR